LHLALQPVAVVLDILLKCNNKAGFFQLTNMKTKIVVNEKVNVLLTKTKTKKYQKTKTKLESKNEN